MATDRKQKNFGLTPKLAEQLKSAALELEELLDETITEKLIVSSVLSWFLALDPVDQVRELNRMREAKLAIRAGGSAGVADADHTDEKARSRSRKGSA